VHLAAVLTGELTETGDNYSSRTATLSSWWYNGSGLSLGPKFASSNPAEAMDF
jgi:hypothetical protein